MGQHGSQRGAPHAHVEAEDEDGVQHRIEDRADQHSLHAHHREALGGDIGVHAQGQLHEYGAQGVNIHIGHAVINSIGAGAECQQQRAVPDEYHRCQHRRHQQLRDKAVAQNLLSFCRLLLA